MHIFTNLQDLQTFLSQYKNKRIGVVPTMGNLHDGHLSLVEQIKIHCDLTLATIFVNPTQFGENEDFDNYPRTLESDIKKLESVNCNILFAPTSKKELYPFGTEHKSLIEIPLFEGKLCAASRPHHFAGVANIVTRILLATNAHVAIFGEKDFQQLQVIRFLVKDLHIPCKIIAAPLAREQDGLAYSSRNNYLTKKEREIASNLYKTLTHITNELLASKDPIVLWNKLRISSHKYLTSLGFIVDYLELCEQEYLNPATVNDTNLVLLVAAKLGKPRLLDNIQFQLNK